MRSSGLYLLIVGVVLRASLALSTVYLEERFDDGDGWKNRWVQSKHKSDYGEFKLSHGQFYGDAEADKGIKSSEDARFYALSRKFDKVFDTTGKTLVVQFSVKHEQKIDCGGAYVKLLPSSTDLQDFHGETPYYIMFGPDICGYSTKLVHVIFNYKGKNLNMKREVSCQTDELTHVYTLIVRPDMTYEVLIDDKSEQSGNLEDDWDFLLPKKIPDPSAKKPDDWDEREMIDDETDKKPDDWEKPETIPDPSAKKPDDWDDDMDGEWEPPVIPNPDYRGEWRPKKIKNPNYRGIWKAPEIDNPEYVADDQLGIYKDIGAVGLDLWQVKAGTIFDNFIVTDDPDAAKKLIEESWAKSKDIEKKKLDEHEEQERKKMEEEAKRKHDEMKKADKTDDDDEEGEDDETEETKSHADDEL